MKFFVGLDHPHHAQHFRRACISVRTIAKRRKPLGSCEVLLDSGAFKELEMFGRYREPPSAYAAIVRRLHIEGVANIVAAVTQDFMCEDVMLSITGLTVREHQRLTIERYDALVAETLPVPVLPVLQGYDPIEYLRHLDDYGDRLPLGAWVGVGSVCKRNGDPRAILDVVYPIKRRRPDLRLHGFGVKLTALAHEGIRELFYSADSMAWSYSARKQGRDNHDWREAARFADRIEGFVRRQRYGWQLPLDLVQ